MVLVSTLLAVVYVVAKVVASEVVVAEVVVDKHKNTIGGLHSMV
jgi:hypothetical protein